MFHPIFKAKLVVLACVFATSAVAAAPKTDKEKLSYSLGYQLGLQVKQNELDIDPKLFASAVEDALTAGRPAMSEEDMRAVVQGFQQKMRAEQMAKMQELAQKNKKESADFLAENKKKKDVKALPSGVQYKVLQAGKGKKPTLDDTVVINYTGALINGKEFDSSAKQGGPATLQLKGTIKGFQDALTHMKEGAKWEVYIPPELAYGERGAPPVIPPNAALVFTIELVDIKK